MPHHGEEVYIAFIVLDYVLEILVPAVLSHHSASLPLRKVLFHFIRIVDPDLIQNTEPLLGQRLYKGEKVAFVIRDVILVPHQNGHVLACH